MARKRIGTILIESGLIDEHQLRAALGMQRQWGGALGRTIVEMGLLDENKMIRALSLQLNMPSVQDVLSPMDIPADALAKLDGEFCLKYSCIPFRYQERGNFLDVAMEDPTNPELFDKIRVRAKCNVRPHLAGHHVISRCIYLAYWGELPSESSQENNLEWMEIYSGERLIDPNSLLGPQASGLQPAGTAIDIHVVEEDDESMVGGDVESDADQEPLSDQAPSEVAQLRIELEELRAVSAHNAKSVVRLKDILRKLLSLMVEKEICSREDLLRYISNE